MSIDPALFKVYVKMLKKKKKCKVWELPMYYEVDFLDGEQAYIRHYKYDKSAGKNGQKS